MKIGVIGGGWYGAHLACSLAKEIEHEVTLFEKNDEIFSGISGKFGIRTHRRQHYPRSEKTRESCHRGFEKFCSTYPELIVEHEYSIYGLGNEDADGKPPKVNLEKFISVCKESKDCQMIETPEEWGYTNLLTAMNIREPSIVVGKRLREVFEQRLKNAGVRIFYNFKIEKLEKNSDGKFVIGINEKLETFDYIINATSFQALLPEAPLPFNMDIVYQPCLALAYKDKEPTARPFSFIVMDGWFPCIMPYVDSEDGKFNGNYILTHGKWTIMGSFKTADEAHDLLNHLDDKFIKDDVKPRCEREIKRFYPEFEKRFEYIGWKSSVLAKIKTAREFRSAVTFASNNIIYIIPGKVSNVFDAEREVLSLINKQNIIADGQYQYIQGGVLHEAMFEITEKINDEERNTSMLQSYEELQKLRNAEQNKLENKDSNTLTYFFHRLPSETQKVTIASIVMPLSNYKSPELRSVQ